MAQQRRPPKNTGGHGVEVRESIMDYDVMDFVQPNVKKIINRYWNETKAWKFIKQCFLQEENIERAAFPWKKLLFCGVSVRPVKAPDNDQDGMQVELNVEIADSMMELREARKPFDHDNMEVKTVQTSVTHIDPEKYKVLVLQLVGEARNGR